MLRGDYQVELTEKLVVNIWLELRLKTSVYHRFRIDSLCVSYSGYSRFYFHLLGFYGQEIIKNEKEKLSKQHDEFVVTPSFSRISLLSRL